MSGAQLLRFKVNVTEYLLTMAATNKESKEIQNKRNTCAGF